MKILMVCLGNICRSPLAEGILKQKIQEKQLDWEVDSAGTSGWHEGELPDQRSIAVAKNHGISILDQRSRPLNTSDLEEFDLILAMDHSNYQNIKKLAKDSRLEEKIDLIMNFAPNEEGTAVPDPYWNDNGFEQVYQMLDRACEGLISAYAKK
ncbi:MAG: low molecular weight phosphotyrosine protein phosphatase [Saprospiraceae bacterium]|nr:low molecular weight phosphotyrosine protein phosphatase [Saprospiraceae bacterium]